MLWSVERSCVDWEVEIVEERLGRLNLDGDRDD